MYQQLTAESAVQFFDREDNNVRCPTMAYIPCSLILLLQTGSLTSNLSDHPQKVKGLIGITLGASVLVSLRSF